MQRAETITSALPQLLPAQNSKNFPSVLWFPVRVLHTRSDASTSGSWRSIRGVDGISGMVLDLSVELSDSFSGLAAARIRCLTSGRSRSRRSSIMFWPAVVLLTTRKGLVRVCLFSVAACLALRVWMYWSGVNPVAGYRITPARLDTLAIGAFWSDGSDFSENCGIGAAGSDCLYGDRMLHLGRDRAAQLASI